MRDKKYVLPGIEYLLIEFLRGPDMPYLLDRSSKIIIDIAWSPFARNPAWDAMKKQMHTYLDKHPVMYDLAISNALTGLGVKPVLTTN